MLSEKNTFSKKQYGFFTTLADPRPPVWQKTIKNTGFFSAPFPYFFTIIMSKIQVGLGCCTLSIVSIAPVRTAWRLRFCFHLYLSLIIMIILISINTTLSVDISQCSLYNILASAFSSFHHLMMVKIIISTTLNIDNPQCSTSWP